MRIPELFFFVMNSQLALAAVYYHHSVDGPDPLVVDGIIVDGSLVYIAGNDSTTTYIEDSTSVLKLLAQTGA